MEARPPRERGSGGGAHVTRLARAQPPMSPLASHFKTIVPCDRFDLDHPGGALLPALHHLAGVRPRAGGCESADGRVCHVLHDNQLPGFRRRPVPLCRRRDLGAGGARGVLRQLPRRRQLWAPQQLPGPWPQLVDAAADLHELDPDARVELVRP